MYVGICCILTADDCKDTRVVIYKRNYFYVCLGVYSQVNKGEDRIYIRQLRMSIMQVHIDTSCKTLLVLCIVTFQSKSNKRRPPVAKISSEPPVHCFPSGTFVEIGSAFSPLSF